MACFGEMDHQTENATAILHLLAAHFYCLDITSEYELDIYYRFLVRERRILDGLISKRL